MNPRLHIAVKEDNFDMPIIAWRYEPEWHPAPPMAAWLPIAAVGEEGFFVPDVYYGVEYGIVKR